MGGIETDGLGATRMPGLFAVGECASNGLHGANRLVPNSLCEIVVFGKVAGEQAALFAKQHSHIDSNILYRQGWKSLRSPVSLMENGGRKSGGYPQ